jgi:hypothetical protein
VRTLFTICSVFLFFFFYNSKHVFQLIYSVKSILTSYKNAFSADPRERRESLNREEEKQAVRQQRIQEAEKIYNQILADRAQHQQESDDDVLQVQEDHPIG